MSRDVRTRFAPSPTGYLHIGGVRTALFNWLFARGHGGRFLLRIDDTDRQRNVEEALLPILAGLRWLGLLWDEGPEVGGDYAPYYQSQRQELHRAAARTLVERGLAYHDYANPEELEVERNAAAAAGARFVYSRRFMAETAQERARFEAAGRSAAVRLKLPREGTCRFRDHVRGEMDLDWAAEQDHVIQRADGTCLYHLASVVDDHAMRISHVIRAEEHLSNTPRQIFIARGLGYEPPEFAHLPFVAEPGSRNKLSKRKLDKYLKNPDFASLNERGQAIARALGLVVSADTFNPVILDFYERIGFLPDAVVNYLLLLGWALDDRSELFTRQEMIASFSLERVNRAPASFDPQKLLAFQGRYMQALPLDRRVELALPYLGRAAALDGSSGDARSRVAAVIRAAGDRIKIAGDVLDYVDFFLPDERLPYDEAAVTKWLRRPAGGPDVLSRFRACLAVQEPFDAPALERRLHEFADTEGLKLGQLVQSVRVAVTGKAVGFGLFDTLAILGRHRTLARIDRALALG